MKMEAAVSINNNFKTPDENHTDQNMQCDVM
jgi:hypothetical protein